MAGGFPIRFGFDDAELQRLMGSFGQELQSQKRKFSWVRGLDTCPKCEEELGANQFFCVECDYGEKESFKKKPPEVSGYNYVINADYPTGKYFVEVDEKLFDTVIIEDYKKLMILETISMVEHNKLIFDTWGFKKTLEKGRGVSILFYGEPGTGKTLMGQAIANKLGKKLEVITASQVLDKFVGESEKKITEIFKVHADKVILFDECDSLLHARSNARTSWEVSQVNVLLHEIEEFEGVTIFTTNHIKNLDKALDRRIALKVKFNMPTPEMRVDIWKRMFPDKAPLSKDIDWPLLASFQISGGYIKNTVLRAARMAAFRGDKEISFKVLKEALRQELEAVNEYDGERGEITNTSVPPDKEKSVEKSA